MWKGATLHSENNLHYNKIDYLLSFSTGLCSSIIAQNIKKYICLVHFLNCVYWLNLSKFWIVIFQTKSKLWSLNIHMCLNLYYVQKHFMEHPLLLLSIDNKWSNFAECTTSVYLICLLISLFVHHIKRIELRQA